METDTNGIPLLGEEGRWRPRAGWTRREFVRLTVNSALAAGIFFVSIFDRTRALATHETPLLPYGEKCYKPANANGTKCCTCGSNVSSLHCGADGWHSQHGATYTCVTYSWKLRYTSCDGQNAWRWLISEWGGTENWRCSDGYYKYWTCDGYESGWIKSVCPKQV